MANMQGCVISPLKSDGCDGGQRREWSVAGRPSGSVGRQSALRLTKMNGLSQEVQSDLSRTYEIPQSLVIQTDLVSQSRGEPGNQNLQRPKFTDVLQTRGLSVESQNRSQRQWPIFRHPKDW